MNFIKEPHKLNFSQRTRYGVIAMLIIFLICVASQKTYNYFFPSAKVEITLTPREKQFIADADSLNKRRIKYINYKKKSKKYSIPKSKFNPNLYSKQDWLNIGLSDKQAQSIINSTSKGFKFRKREDVSKLYVVSDKLYQKLKPWIDLPDSIVYINERENKPYLKKTVGKENKTKIDINTVKEEGLIALKGIGEKLSKRIIKYRDLIGGFSNLQQLKDVYGLSPEVIEENKNYLIFDKTQIIKIKVNSVTVEELKAHPFFDWKIANLVVKYKESHGNYKTVDDLKELVLIDDAFFEKIKDYISIE